MRPSSKQRTQERAFLLLLLATLVVVGPILGVVYYVFARGWQAVTWEFLTAAPRAGMKEGGIYPAIVGTLYLVAGTVAVALPLGVGTAIYLTEYARETAFSRTIRLAIINLAGVPSVVYGLFGLAVFVILLGFGSSILAGSLTLAILVLPVIITAAEEALRSVPVSFRQASLALGATKWETVRHVVLPAAMPGILTGTILGVGRAAGETAPILFTVAAFYLPFLPRSVFDQVMALPYHLYVVSTQVAGMPEKVQYGTAIVLLALVLGMNLVAIVIRARFRRGRRW